MRRSLSHAMHKRHAGTLQQKNGARVTLFRCTQKNPARSSLINIAQSTTSKTMLPTARLLPDDEFIFRAVPILS